MPISNKPSLNLDTFGYTFYFENLFITKNKEKTYLSDDLTSGGISLSVLSIIGLSGTGHIFLLGEIGDTKTEIVKCSNGTAPSGTTIALQTACLFDHSQDTKVTVLDYDQLALSRATGILNQKSTLTTKDLQVSQLKSNYKDSNTSGYGFLELKNSISLAFSRVSDPVPYVGFADNTVFMIKKRALDEVGEVISDIITHDFLNAKLWEARREYHSSPGKRPFRRKLDIDIGNVSTGENRVEAPTDLQDPYTSENIYGVRIGTEGNMNYMDKKIYDLAYKGVAKTELSIAYTIGDQDLYCDDVRDLDDSGTIELENDSIEYSAKGVDGGTLRISADGSYAHALDTNVWQGVSMGLPTKFALFKTNGSAYIYFDKPFSTSYVNQNIWCDYYRKVVEYDSDADELDEPNYDMFVHFLSYSIKKLKDKGIKKLDDEDFLLWTDLKRTSLKSEYLGSVVRFIPSVDHLPV